MRITKKNLVKTLEYNGFKQGTVTHDYQLIEASEILKRLK